jgi:cell division septation protein DedD
MANNEAESGLELVLDNRKLILAFALLVAICGCFFVVGFIEGKRQGYQEGSQIATETAPKPAGETIPAAVPKAAKDETRPQSQQPADQPLDWYRSVNSNEDRPGASSAAPPAAVPAAKPTVAAVTQSEPAAPKKMPTPVIARQEPVATAKKPAAKAPSSGTEKSKSAASTESETYSVQVGAFRQKHEMEVRAKALKEKGFECRMESPTGSNQFFFLKVGRFKTRADASAMKLRLEKAGISSFVKVN